MFREDRLQPTFKRVRRTVTIGPVSSLSRRQALAALQPYLDAVNTAPAPTVKYQIITQPDGWTGAKEHQDTPTLINLRLDPFERAL